MNIERLVRSKFLFSELVKRDFKKKYKRTALGMLWSGINPLLQLAVMKLVFTYFFGRTTAHYTTYLFSGLVVFNYFSESTQEGMTSLISNASIFTKVNVPKYIFLLSKNITSLINFGLTLLIYFIFAIADGIVFNWTFIYLLYPMVCLILFNIGVGLILSALFVFFKDIQYLYRVFIQLLTYLSAIFYNIEDFSLQSRYLFYLNPIYVYIRYFRKIVIESTVPAPSFHILAASYSIIVLVIGGWMYKKHNRRFLFYV